MLETEARFVFITEDFGSPRTHQDTYGCIISFLLPAGRLFLPAIYWHLSSFQQHMDTKFNAATFEIDAFYIINISHL